MLMLMFCFFLEHAGVDSMNNYLLVKCTGYDKGIQRTSIVYLF